MKTPYCSYKIGELAKGCQLCVKGLKTVLFITGICSKKPLCFYCPISDLKLGEDVVYANEWKVKNNKEIIQEIKLCNSKGVGITGGDPLCRLMRTVKIIKLLKNTFGKKFHIHLYTPLNFVNGKNLKKLYFSGLDEIRFHPDVENDKLWHKIKLAKKYNWKIGVEIPVIPGKEKETKKLINFIKDKIDFLNLNELEYSDTSYQNLKNRNLITKEALSYGIKGSEELAIRLLNFCSKLKINAHYCTAKLKDKVQMAKRIKRRAKNVALPFDKITKDGTIIRACLYLNDLTPGLGYRKKLLSLNNKQRNQYLKSLKKLKNFIKKNYKIKELVIDNNKLRLILNKKYLKTRKNLRFFVSQKPLVSVKIKNIKKAIVEEYPTWDGIEMNVEFIK